MKICFEKYLHRPFLTGKYHKVYLQLHRFKLLWWPDGTPSHGITHTCGLSLSERHWLKYHWKVDDSELAMWFPLDISSPPQFLNNWMWNWKLSSLCFRWLTGSMSEDGSKVSFKQNHPYVPEMWASISAYDLLAWVIWVVQGLLKSS